MNERPRVIIVGAGFGGLYAAQTLKNKPVDVLLVDRNNFHTFTPLLYQVATAGLEAEEIAYPVRGIFRSDTNINFLMGEVTAIDREAKAITIRTNGASRSEHYDYLLVAGGSVTSYFGKPETGAYAFELKSLDDAVVLRNHILRLFERAAWTDDDAHRSALTTIVVVGGGATGLETIGAIRELYQHVLRKEYAALSPRIVLVEAADHLLAAYPERLREKALEQLKSLGVEVILGDAVAETAPDHIQLAKGELIPTYTLIWSAGVQASPLAQLLDLPLKKGGRVPITPTLVVEGDENVYVVGDMAYLEAPDGKPYPMLIPVAKQQGILAAKNMLRRLAGEQPQTFHYSDRGIMATIGRRRAVAWIFNRVQLTGYLAWIAWLGLHLVSLMGFRNRLNVLVNWVWNYLTYDRSVRIILEPGRAKPEHADEALQSVK